MSSRRLLVILDGLPNEGRYKTARRNGRQTRAERVAEELYNELAILRSWYITVNSEEGRGYYEAAILRDPVDELAQARQEAQDAEAAKDAQQRFESEIGFT